MNNFPIRLILDNLRSAHNVGAILRTADASGVELVCACGTTPYPEQTAETRPPHVAQANTKSIAKTALGAHTSVPIPHYSATTEAIAEASLSGFKIIVLEQSEKSLNLYQFAPDSPVALIVGNEVEGVGPEIIALADAVLELPMLGAKESLNVASAAAVALYQIRFGTSAPQTPATAAPRKTQKQ